MAETTSSTGSDQGVNEYLAGLARIVEHAEDIKDCMGKRPCPLMGILHEIAQGAIRELVNADPKDRLKIVRLQEVAKIYDTIAEAIEIKFKEADTAFGELKDIHEEGIRNG